MNDFTIPSAQQIAQAKFSTKSVFIEGVASPVASIVFSFIGSDLDIQVYPTPPKLNDETTLRKYANVLLDVCNYIDAIRLISDEIKKQREIIVLDEQLVEQEKIRLQQLRINQDYLVDSPTMKKVLHEVPVGGSLSVRVRGDNRVYTIDRYKKNTYVLNSRTYRLSDLLESFQFAEYFLN